MLRAVQIRLALWTKNDPLAGAVPAGRTGIVYIQYIDHQVRTPRRWSTALSDVVAYIDGFNLYFGIKAKFRRRYLWLDLVRLVELLRPNDHVVVVRYFTTVVKGEPAAAANQIHYIDALQAHCGPRLDVQRG